MKLENIGIYTALVSVATAEVTNIMINVTAISITKAWTSVPDGVVVPKSGIGYSTCRNVKAPIIAPINWATAYNGTYSIIFFTFNII